MVERAERRGAQPALVQGGRTTSYAELAGTARQVAGAVRAAAGGTGARIALLTAHLPTWAAAVMGCSLSGAVPVPLNWRLAGRELRAILDDAEASLLIADPEHAERLAGDLVGWPGTVVQTGAAFDAWCARATRGGGDPALLAAQGGGQDVALQLYTSGTTGRPKGVQLTHANLYWLIERGRATIRVEEGCRNLFTLPPFHIAGAGFALITLYTGALGIVPPNAKVGTLIEAIAEHRVTNTGLVPSLVQELLDHPARATNDLSSVRTVIYGAAPMPPPLLTRVLQELPWGFLHTYGLTESAGFVTELTPEEHDPAQPARLRSCGRAVPWAELRASDMATGAPLGPGEVGELQVRSPSVMKGYWHAPDATAAALAPDGWLRTGDIGRVDADGYIYVLDRRNAMIITGGENVYPAEVESVLGEHPAVRQAAVAGVPHERWGETVKAFVVPARGATVEAQELIAFARERLAHFKCPSQVEVLDELPLNATGKVDRAALRAR